MIIFVFYVLEIYTSFRDDKQYKLSNDCEKNPVSVCGVFRWLKFNEHFSMLCILDCQFTGDCDLSLVSLPLFL